MILKIQHGMVEYAGSAILADIDFEIKNKNEKIAVVGRNGCGKTTLLKLIAGDIELTRHDGDTDTAFIRAKGTEIGYLRQIAFEDETLTLDEEIRKVYKNILDMKQRLNELVALLSDDTKPAAEHERLAHEYTELEETFKDMGGYYYEKEYDTALLSFGFSKADRNKRLSEFSGGQRTKLAFIKLLLAKPDVLLLDEPTNHLDITAIEWLEGYIKGYPNAVVIVSHDRMFLDNTVDVVYEIEKTKMKRYAGNYTYFFNKKREDYEYQLKAYKSQQKEIKRLEDVAQRFIAKPTKTSMARSKLKAIEHMDKIDAPDDYDNRTFSAAFQLKAQTGNDVLFVNRLSVGYDFELANVSFDLKRGQRLAVIGSNGVGKSTLLKTLVGIHDALSGEYKYGVHVSIGYFDQQMAEYTSDKQVIDDFWDEYPNLTETEVRSCLGAFLFTGDDVFKTVNMLSGGERVRLALCKIFKSGPNVLVLDEPTNHMDIIGKETLEDMLLKYEGTVIFVSHDRYFVKKVSTLILAMDAKGSRLWQLGYDDYIEKTRGETQAAISGEAGAFNNAAESLYKKDAAKAGRNDKIKENRLETAGETSYRISKEQARNKRRIEKIENEIEKLENEIDEEKKKLEDEEIAKSYMELTKVQDKIDKLEAELCKLMDEWEALNEG